jgi:hypothetical protein
MKIYGKYLSLKSKKIESQRTWNDVLITPLIFGRFSKIFIKKSEVFFSIKGKRIAENDEW